MKSLALMVLVGLATLQPPVDPCAPGGERHNADRPWMCGSVEKSCATAEAAYHWKQEEPERLILACECKHGCVADYKYAGETDRRAWDPVCEARCNPRNCRCEHPCELTDGAPGRSRALQD